MLLLASNDYGPPFVAATFKRGITPWFTSEIHTELLTSQQNLGVGAHVKVGCWGMMNVAVAGSYSQSLGSGILGLIGAKRRAMGGFSCGASFALASQYFVDLQSVDNQLPNRFQTNLFIGQAFRNKSSLGAFYTQQNDWLQNTIRILNISYTKTLFSKWMFSINFMKNNLNNWDDVVVFDGNHSAIYVSVSRLLGDKSVSFGAASQQGSTGAYGQINKNLPQGPGWGYNLYGLIGD